MNLSKFKHDSIEALKSIDVEIVQEIVEAIKGASRVFIFGNGGSATTASHFALDCTKNAQYPVLCLNDNPGMLTAVANDEIFDNVFCSQLVIHGLTANDVVIGISTSGNSWNIIKAIEFSNGLFEAYPAKAKTIILTGFDGGQLANVSGMDIHLHINSDVIEAVEDAHLAALHMVVRGLKDEN